MTGSVDRSGNRVGGATRFTVSHGRTDGRTDGEGTYVTGEISPYASPAGGLNADSLIGHETARRQQSEDPTTRAVALRSPSPRGPAFWGRRLFAQSYPGRPLARTTDVRAASTPLTHRRALIIGCPSTPRDSLAACSPVARWHGKSDGSDPLRPSRELTADRCKETIALYPESYRRGPVPLWTKGAATGGAA